MQNAILKITCFQDASEDQTSAIKSVSRLTKISHEICITSCFKSKNMH